MTDTDRLEQIRLLEAALNERNAELKRVRDQRDMLRVELHDVQREVCDWCALFTNEPPQVVAIKNNWDCFQGAR